LFFESVFVAVICRPGTAGLGLLHPSFLGRHPWTHVPQLALFTFIAALTFLVTRFLIYRQPVEVGLLWSLAASFLALQVGGVGRVASAYVATAGLILASSIIENSYFLAYHDELTTLPARRAFNEALLRLETPFAVAVVDIDHFKTFNDTYGHETGDQVLRMVASRLAHISGGCQSYRVGGEEFSILFSGKTVKEVLPHLESLRSVIEASAFRLRGGEERRSVSRTAGLHREDRRKDSRRNEDRREQPSKVEDGSDQAVTTAARRTSARRARSRIPEAGRDLSVTVSIGVAEPNAKTREVEQVIQAADKALYRAKQAGRNRVESAAAPRTRSPRPAKPSVA
jgi:diguanylate cyclase (GGDEF)-like protein